MNKDNIERVKHQHSIIKNDILARTNGQHPLFILAMGFKGLPKSNGSKGGLKTDYFSLRQILFTQIWFTPIRNKEIASQMPKIRDNAHKYLSYLFLWDGPQWSSWTGPEYNHRL